MALEHLQVGSPRASFNMSASQPVNDLEAAGAAAMRDAAAAAPACAESDVGKNKAIADEFAAGAEEKEIDGGVVPIAAGIASPVSAKRKLLQANAVDGMTTSRAGDGDGAKACEF